MIHSIKIPLWSRSMVLLFYKWIRVLLPVPATLQNAKHLDNGIW